MSGLWELVVGKPQIDPTRLAEALQREVRPGLDYRTRRLVRDSADALENYWGRGRWSAWLERSGVRDTIDAIRREPMEDVGFPHLAGALMERTAPETVRQFLRELSLHLRTPVELNIGGAIALILHGRLERHTEDIDVVDEVPAELREQHSLLASLSQRYGLQLTHFQSHYLPSGWKERRHFLDAFGSLQIYLVDEVDIFLGKLFSQREKDRDDLRLLLPGMDREALKRRLVETCQGLLAEASLREAAELNWHILTGETLG
jgi:hypothetical protein